MLHRQLADLMALAGAAENYQPGRHRETGSAKKRSHNASHSKHLVMAGARRKAGGVVTKGEHSPNHPFVAGALTPAALIYSRVTSRGQRPRLQRGFETVPLSCIFCGPFFGMKLKGLSLGLL